MNATQIRADLTAALDDLHQRYWRGDITKGAYRRARRHAEKVAAAQTQAARA